MRSALPAGRSSRTRLLWFLVVLAVVLLVFGRMAFQALTAEDREPAPSFVEQVQALPFVEEVETESDRIVGTTRARQLESWIVLSPDVVSDPVGVAEGLAGVTWGYDRSWWTVSGHGSTAEVSDLGPVAAAPVRWWTESVAALAEADPAAALHCRLLDFALRCEVDTSDPDTAVGALARVDGSRIGPWLEAVHADEGEEKGFSLEVGDRGFTDASRIG